MTAIYSVFAFAGGFLLGFLIGHLAKMDSYEKQLLVKDGFIRVLEEHTKMGEVISSGKLVVAKDWNLEKQMKHTVNMLERADFFEPQDKEDT